MVKYDPPTGTIPHRVIEHLRSMPCGTELTTSVLADAIGHGGQNLGPYLRAAINHGVLTTRKKAGDRNLWWSLGNGIPLADPDDDPDDEQVKQLLHEVTPSRPPAPPKSIPAETIAQIGEVNEAAETAPSAAQIRATSFASAAGHAKAVQRTGTTPFRVGLFSDGELHLQKGSQSIVLERFEFESLVHFLERMVEQVT